jgi:Flp pilus assembly pilin Flp
MHDPFSRLAGWLTGWVTGWAAARLERLREQHRLEPERGGPMTEYAIILGIAAAAIALVVAVIAFIRTKFAAFGG